LENENVEKSNMLGKKEKNETLVDFVEREYKKANGGRRAKNHI
jgi:hypothetical protein